VKELSSKIAIFEGKQDGTSMLIVELEDYKNASVKMKKDLQDYKEKLVEKEALIVVCFCRYFCNFRWLLLKFIFCSYQNSRYFLGTFTAHCYFTRRKGWNKWTTSSKRHWINRIKTINWRKIQFNCWKFKRNFFIISPIKWF